MVFLSTRLAFVFGPFNACSNAGNLLRALNLCLPVIGHVVFWTGLTAVFRVLGGLAAHGLPDLQLFVVTKGQLRTHRRKGETVHAAATGQQSFCQSARCRNVGHAVHIGPRACLRACHCHSNPIALRSAAVLREDASWACQVGRLSVFRVRVRDVSATAFAERHRVQDPLAGPPWGKDRTKTNHIKKNNPEKHFISK